MVTSALVDMWVGIGLFVLLGIFAYVGPRTNIEWLPAKRRREEYWRKKAEYEASIGAGYGPDGRQVYPDGPISEFKDGRG